jgi:hypothetical protein
MIARLLDVFTVKVQENTRPNWSSSESCTLSFRQVARSDLLSPPTSSDRRITFKLEWSTAVEHSEFDIRERCMCHCVVTLMTSDLSHRAQKRRAVGSL